MEWKDLNGGERPMMLVLYFLKEGNYDGGKGEICEKKLYLELSGR